MARPQLRLLGAQLTICAAGYGVHVDNLPPLLVCGRPPGHEGPHHDVQWAIAWKEPASG